MNTVILACFKEDSERLMKTKSVDTKMCPSPHASNILVSRV